MPFRVPFGGDYSRGLGRFCARWLGPILCVWVIAAAAHAVAQKTAVNPVESPAAETSTNAAVPPIPDAAAPVKVKEEWSVVYMGGKRAGFQSITVSERATKYGKQYFTVSHQEFKLGRMGAMLGMTAESKITEDENGVVINFESLQSGAGTEVTVQGFRVGDDLKVVSNGAERRYHSPAKEALGPRAVEERTKTLKLEKGAKMEIPAFAAEYPQGAVVLSTTVDGQEKKRFEGKDVLAWKTTTTMSYMPGLPMISWVDNDMNIVGTSMNIPVFGSLEVVVCTKEEAMQELEGADLMGPSLIHPSEPLKDHKKLASATYRLTLSKGTGDLTVFDGPEQRVLDSIPGQTRIEVKSKPFTAADAGFTLPVKSTPEIAKYLTNSTYLENTELLRKLGREAVGDEKNPVIAGQKIEQFVRRYISKKNLTIGFASADETARSKEGDCTEHAVLCAALARTVGLPSRTVIGLGYLPFDYEQKGDQNGTFGFHMWAEVLVAPDKWMPVDAALNGFDVGHIAIYKSALEEANPIVELTMPVLKLMGGMKVDVEAQR